MAIRRRGIITNEEIHAYESESSLIFYSNGEWNRMYCTYFFTKLRSGSFRKICLPVVIVGDLSFSRPWLGCVDDKLKTWRISLLYFLMIRYDDMILYYLVVYWIILDHPWMVLFFAIIITRVFCLMKVYLETLWSCSRFRWDQFFCLFFAIAVCIDLLHLQVVIIVWVVITRILQRITLFHNFIGLDNHRPHLVLSPGERRCWIRYVWSWVVVKVGNA